MVSCILQKEFIVVEISTNGILYLAERVHGSGDQH